MRSKTVYYKVKSMLSMFRKRLMNNWGIVICLTINRLYNLEKSPVFRRKIVLSIEKRQSQKRFVMLSDSF